MLTFEKVPSESVNELYDVDLAKKASQLLNYNVYHSKINKEINRRNLIRLLSKNGINVYNTESVAKYKWRKAFMATVWLHRIVLIPLAISTTIAISFPMINWSKDIVSIIGTFWVISVISSGVIGLVYGLGLIFGDLPRYTWNSIPLYDYQNPIPDYVLETAIKIREIYPLGSMRIEELSYTKPIDPFLVIDGLYVEVWNESKFGKGN